MKRHLITFLALALLELGIGGAAAFAAKHYAAKSADQQRQVNIMRQAHSVFVADQRALASQAAEGQAYREYRAQWEARMKEYDAPSKVVEILNAEASRAGVSSPRLNDSKGLVNAFDITTYGRLNELIRWLSSAEGRVDLLVVDELVLTSQVDSTLSLNVRARLLGIVENKPVDQAKTSASGTRRNTNQKK